MGENTKIEWAHHTLNFWTGCTKISPACAHCYAESWAKRSGLVVWGDTGTRRKTTQSNWNQAYKWNSRAKANDVRERVFVNSLSDWAEKRDELNPIRREMFELISGCDWLDFLLLTKRADNIQNCLPDDWTEKGAGYPNVWLGVTVENQEWADKRIPHLFRVPARIRFLSCEPLLGALDISGYLPCVQCKGSAWFKDEPCLAENCYGGTGKFGKVDLVICGGESGHGARPMSIEWARSLRDQCVAAGVAFHFKQWGEFSPYGTSVQKMERGTGVTINYLDGQPLYRVGKKIAGRMLDGKIWDEMPA